MGRAVLSCQSLVKVYPSSGGDVRAVDGLDLQVQAGESVVVIGPNGAGKSTLLRLIAGITEPTAGRVERSRRTTGLIELGAGFEPELSGRENLDLTLALSGYGARARRRIGPDVLQFSGIGQAIDRPVKQYSAGMVARLGLAAALHSEPELLLVDEVLTVGDSAFQRRSLSRMRTMISHGCALVLVTHQLPLARRIASTAVWMEQGREAGSGDPYDVVANYERHHSVDSRFGPQEHTQVVSVELRPSEVGPGDPVDVHLRVRTRDAESPVEVRVDLRAPVGDDTRWMLDRHDTAQDLEMNTIGRTSSTVVDLPPTGLTDVIVSLPEVPLTATVVDVVAVVIGQDRWLLDELGAPLSIRTGDEVSTEIPQLFVEALGPF